MFFGKKTAVDKYILVYIIFGKMPRKTGKTVDQSIMHTTIVGLPFT